MPKCGMVCEIFSRVCGYHRPVKNWNKGQQEQFNDRKEYNPEESLKKKIAKEKQSMVENK